jgi:orotate phosphoribosyltransferase
MYSKDVAQSLLDKGAVKVSLVNPFRWTSGIVSPIYCDNRLMISHVDAREIILDGFVKKIAELGLEFDYLAGTATAGIPWAAFLAEKLGVPMVYVRATPKQHGTGKQVEGDLAFLMKKKALVIEDLISTGGSSINTAVALRNEVQAEDVFVLSIFQYGLAIAATKFAENEVKYDSLTNFSTLLSVSELSEDERTKVLEFAKDPQNWYLNLNS